MVPFQYLNLMTHLLTLIKWWWGIASLSKIVQDSTSGIGTSIAKCKTAVTRGVADMITAINNGIKSLDITTHWEK